MYQYILDENLLNIELILLLYTCYNTNAFFKNIHNNINLFYKGIIHSLMAVCSSFCVKKPAFIKNLCVPGWNEYAAEKHQLTRSAFVEWCCYGKPKFGSLFYDMRCTRTESKSAFKYCKKHEEQIRADQCEYSFDLADAKSFWRNVHKSQ